MRTEKVSHPNSKLSEVDALKQLYEHPQFPKGAKVTDLKHTEAGWDATLEIPDTAKQAAPPPFPPAEDSGDEPPKPPSDEKPSDDSDSSSEDKPKDEKPDEVDPKADLNSIFDLVKQIAQHVGVPVPGEEHSELEEALGEEGPPKPPPHPPAGPPAGAAPKGGPVRPGGLRPGMAPPGTTPVGAPAFASTQNGNSGGIPPVVAADVPVFNVREETDVPLKQCAAQVEEIYGPFGYRVAKAKEEAVDGKRVVRIQVSKR